MRARAPHPPRSWATGLWGLALLGCQREPAAELLEVNRIVASEAQFGDALQIAGDGFALGKPVLVRFRGQVYRAGAAERSVDIALAARAESQHELSVPLPREAEREFGGSDSEAAHLTFRGDVQVAIAANEPGAPPVTGTLHGSTLELYPALEARARTEQRSALGRRALAFFGIEVADARQGGLSVRSVLPGSRAAAADLEAGDRIVRAGGLNVLEPSDLVPERARGFELGVDRRAVPLTLLLDADGFHDAPPRALAGAALLTGLSALGLVFWASPLLRLLAALVPHWLEQVRARYAAAASRGRWSWSLLCEPLGGSLGALVWLGVGAALLAPALRRTPIDLGLGLLALAFGSATLLIATSLIEGGRRDARWSLRRGLATALQQFLVIAPAGIALLSISLESGVDADEWVRAQGALPWAWNAFDNPGASLLLLCTLLTALPQSQAPRGRLRHARALAAEPGWSLLGAIYAWSLCALAALAFLGGGAGFGEAAPLDVGTSRLAASLLAWVKYACLCGALSWLRGLSQRLTLEQWAPLGLWLVLPGSLAALLLSQAWRGLEASSPFWHWLLSGFGPLSVALLALALPVAVASLLSALRRSERFAGLSPWL